ncbi:MAG: transcription termination factor Rho [Blastocatellia bacterium]|nr:transcription termination factor Rho [Blastocatellia bacterium]
MTTETQQLSVAGLLEIGERGFGFLRDPKVNFRARTGDPFVTARLIEDAGLDEGLLIEGGADEPAAADRRTGRGPQLVSIRHINGVEASVWKPDVPFAELVSIDPEDPFRLARGPDDLAMRVVELVAPIGHGQRGLIVAPPKSGKTTLIEQLATGFSENHPDVDLLVVLIDERPEEVTHLKRTIRGEVVASTSDEDTEVQLRLARLMLERAKRLVEAGRHVVLLLDSITRFGRASNRGQAGRGRTMSGGIDTRALEFPRKFFGAARNAEDGGSLTILATAIVGSGSQMDEVIFQEFKGTGNMELVLDRRIAERRVFPAIDVAQSGTRKEEKLFDAWEMPRIRALRRALSTLKSTEATEALLKAVRDSASNRELLDRIPIE